MVKLANKRRYRNIVVSPRSGRGQEEPEVMVSCRPVQLEVNQGNVVVIIRAYINTPATRRVAAREVAKFGAEYPPTSYMSALEFESLL